MAVQNADVSHVLEYHPGNASAHNDGLTTLKAAFSDKVAGVYSARQEATQANTIRIRTAELMKQSSQIQRNNTLQGMSSKPRLTWTDASEDVMDRMDSGLGTRMLPLRPDFKYVAPARAAIVADLAQHESAFAIMAAAAYDFSLELIVPHGSARSQNVEGARQFETERTRQMLSLLTSVTQTAFVIAYRKQFENLFAEYHKWRARNAVAADVAQAYYPDMDVEIEMQNSSSATYEQMKQLWLDGLMSKDTLAQHGFRLYSIPDDQVHVTKDTDRMPTPPETKKQKKNP